MLSIAKFLHQKLFSLDGAQFVRAFEAINRLRWHIPIHLEYSLADRCYVVNDFSIGGTTPSKMFFSRKERIWIYAKGVQNRLEKLGEVYSLKYCNLKPQDVVIDCGANIGEFSALVRSCYGSTVIAVEPETDEARCIPFNVPGVHHVINAALWHEETELKFFSKNRSADSSIFETEDYDEVITVPTMRLDDLFDRYGLDQIKLFKLEAEGAEPEILLGATRALPHIEFISADLGPERGLAQESTVIPVCNYLFKFGFELVSLYHKRQVYLFRNSQLKTKV